MASVSASQQDASKTPGATGDNQLRVGAVTFDANQACQRLLVFAT